MSIGLIIIYAMVFSPITIGVPYLIYELIKYEFFENWIMYMKEMGTKPISFFSQILHLLL